jgi:hypothetical protein
MIWLAIAYLAAVAIALEIVLRAPELPEETTRPPDEQSPRREE